MKCGARGTSRDLDHANDFLNLRDVDAVLFAAQSKRNDLDDLAGELLFLFFSAIGHHVSHTPENSARAELPADVRIAHQRMYVDDQRDRTVAQDRRARDARDPADHVGERFDDDFLLAFERVDHQADLAPLQSDDHDHHLVRVARPAELEEVRDAQQRNDLAAQRDHFVTVHAANVGHLDALRFDDRIERNRVQFFARRVRAALE